MAWRWPNLRRNMLPCNLMKIAISVHICVDCTSDTWKGWYLLGCPNNLIQFQPKTEHLWRFMSTSATKIPKASCKVPDMSPILTKFEFYRQIFIKSPQNFTKIRPVGAALIQADRRTDSTRPIGALTTIRPHLKMIPFTSPCMLHVQPVSTSMIQQN